MKINLTCVGKTNEKHIIEGINIYQKRIERNYIFNIQIIADARKGLSQEQQKIEEGE